LERKFIPNAISFNINADKPFEFYYDEDEHTLTIYYCTLDIADGWHRYLAMTNAKDRDSSLECNTIVNILNFSEDKAKRYIVQEDKKNRIKKSKIKSLDVDNNYSKIVNNLNEHSKSDLCDLIGTSNGCMIDFELLVNLIKLNFIINDNADLINVKNYTIQSFNSLIEDNQDLITQKQSNLTWAKYVRLMKYNFETKDIDAFMSEVHRINNIDLSQYNIKADTISKKLLKNLDNILNLQ
jgi:hypothetical protein